VRRGQRVRVHGKRASRPTSSAAQARQATPMSPTVKKTNWGEPIGLPRPGNPALDGRLAPAAASSPLLPSPQGLHHGTAAGHGRSGPSCRVRAARAGMAAILAASRWSQRSPFGRRARRQVMTSSPATITSRRKSWPVSGNGSSRTCSGWTVVATTVSVPIRPASTSSANSRSEEAARRGGTSSRAGSRRIKGVRPSGGGRPCTAACRRPGLAPGPGAAGRRGCS
jgi:hypothetical protein